MGDGSALKGSVDLQELLLVPNGQDHDPDLSLGRGWTQEDRFSCGVNELSGYGSERKVVSNYLVVVGAILMSPVVLGGGMTVKLGS